LTRFNHAIKQENLHRREQAAAVVASASVAYQSSEWKFDYHHLLVLLNNISIA
jgi:hypothetical protein